jgi:hypothetical protein
MRVVIEISDTVYDSIKKVQNICGNIGSTDGDLSERLMYAVANGSPLPKGHGRLIDADEVLKALETWDRFGYKGGWDFSRLHGNEINQYLNYIRLDNAEDCIKNTDTIIQADKETENEDCN